MVTGPSPSVTALHYYRFRLYARGRCSSALSFFGERLAALSSTRTLVLRLDGDVSSEYILEREVVRCQHLLSRFKAAIIAGRTSSVLFLTPIQGTSCVFPERRQSPGDSMTFKGLCQVLVVSFWFDSIVLLLVSVSV
jgi:hypothetical protein